MTSNIRFISAAVLMACASLSAQAAPSFVNGLALDGAALDLSGGSSVNNGRLGYFSDIYYDTNRNEWWGLSDRGPGGRGARGSGDGYALGARHDPATRSLASTVDYGAPTAAKPPQDYPGTTGVVERTEPLVVAVIDAAAIGGEHFTHFSRFITSDA